MKRRTAIRLYRFLFWVYVVGLCAGCLRLISDLASGVFIYWHWLGSLVGGAVGCYMAVLCFRQWKTIEVTSDEEWHRAWFIQPSNKS
jgi:hypothetical protein